MDDVIITNANLPLAIRWWIKMYGRCTTYRQRNGNFLITLDMNQDHAHYHTMISISELPDNLEIELDISDLAWPVQEALRDCFNQGVIEPEDLEIIYNYDS
jgi:hypothetical protein